MQAKKRIEAEFDEPLQDVIAGFAEMKYSRRLVADTLEVTYPSLRKFTDNVGIHFSRRPVEHRQISGRPPRRVRHASREMSLTGWAKELGLSVEGVRKRIRTTGAPC